MEQAHVANAVALTSLPYMECQPSNREAPALPLGAIENDGTLSEIGEDVLFYIGHAVARTVADERADRWKLKADR